MIEFIKRITSRKALQNVSFVYFGSLINGASLMLINILLARLLSKDIFGIFSLSIMVLTTVAEMSDLGLNGGLLRFGPYYIKNNQAEKLKQLVKTIWRWRVWMSVAITVVGVAAAPLLAHKLFNRPETLPYLMFSFLGVGGVILLGFTATFLQAQERFANNAVLQSLKGLLRLILVAALYYAGVADLFVYLLIYIAVPWLLFAFSYRYLPEDFNKVQIDEESKKHLHKDLARFSFWLTIWSLTAILSSRVDQTMLAHMLGLEQVAAYAMAFQFVYLYSLGLQSVSAVLLPKINGLTSNEEVWAYAKRVFRWILPAAALALLLIYPSKFVIAWFFGEKYIDSIPVYLVLSYSMIISFVGIPFSLIITAFNRTQLVAASGLLQLAANVLLNMYLIPRYGVIGAGLTFAIGIALSFVYNVLSAAYLFKYQKISVA